MPPSRRYAGYSDPALGAAFENLADIFAPPSAQELAAYANANATREKAQRLADVYGMRDNPDQAARDRAAIAAGLYNPTQSYYNVDTTATTQRRGQDVDADTRRYGFDVGARTALATNAADNERALMDIIMRPTPAGGSVVRPRSVAEKYGVPEQSIGVITAKPGDKIFAPDGRTLEGAPKPLSDSEMKALIIGRMTPEEQRAIGFGNTPVETTRKGPMTRPQMLDSGTPAAPSQRGQFFNYLTPDGRTGTATEEPISGRLVDAQTGQPLPGGVRLQAPSGAQGSAGALGPTTSNRTEANSLEANLNVTESLVDEYAALLKTNPGIVGLPGAIRGGVQNAVSVVEEFARAFGDTVPQAKLAEQDVKELAERIAVTSRDPAIAQARIMQADLAYKWAKMQDPRGEVSRQAFERALEALSGGTLANNQAALEALEAVRGSIKRARDGVASLRNPGQARAGTGSAPQGAASAPQALPQVGANGEGYDQLAPGDRYIGPDGRVRTKR